MTVIREGQEGSILQNINEVVVVEQAPEILVQGDSTNGIGIVFQSTKGNPNEILVADSLTKWTEIFGDYLEGLDGYMEAKNAFDAGAGFIYGVRVVSSGTAKASVSMTGQATTGTVMTWTYPSVGTAGNSAVVTITNSSATGFVDILVRDGLKQTSYLQVTTDSSSSRYLAPLVNQDSNKVLDLTLAVTNGTLPATGTYTLSGGSNGAITGSALSDTFYVGVETSSGRTGLQVFKETDEVIEVRSARMSDDIITALITHVNDLSLSPRRTTVNFAQGTTVDQAITKMAGINDDKVQVIFPMAVVKNPFSGVEEYVNPSTFKTALDTVLSYNLSASQLTLPNTVIKTEFNLTNGDIQRLAKARITPIRKVRGQGIIYEKDITTSSLKSLEQKSLRKAKDFFALTFEDNLRPFLSKPITGKLLGDAQSALKTFLGLEARAGRIGKLDGSTPYSVDMSKNTVDTAKQNRILVFIEISLFGFADKIFVYYDASIEKTIVNTN